jgi:hypothetical protein
MIKTIEYMFKKYWGYLVVALVIAFLLRQNFGAEFFDLFGVFIFAGLIGIGLWELYSKKQMKNWVAFIIIIIGFVGLLIDGTTSIQLIKSYFHIG